MKTFFLLLSILLSAFSISAQNTIAKLKYEQAEEAYNNNDFQTTLVKLDEAQNLLGKVNPKLLYLRIMAQKGIINNSQFDYAVLEATRKNVQYYLKNYENNEGVEEKYRDVFLFAEDLEKYPANKAAWERHQIEQQAATNKAQRVINEKRIWADFYIKDWCKVAKWKPGLSAKEFKDFNSKVNFFSMPRHKIGDSVVYTSNSGYAGGYPYSLHGKNDVMNHYVYVVFSGKETFVRNKMELIRSEILARFPAQDLLINNSGEISLASYTNPQRLSFSLYSIKDFFFIKAEFRHNGWQQFDMNKIWNNPMLLNSFAWDIYENANDKASWQLALKAIMRSIELKRDHQNTEIYAAFLFRNDQKSEAFQQAAIAVDLAGANDQDFKSTYEFSNADFDKGYYHDVTTKKYDSALYYYRKAAATGYGLAMNNIGLLYENGYGVTKDVYEAAKWYRLSADKGNAWGFYYLGKAYYHGIGVAKDANEALNYFLQSAAKNNVWGMVGAADTYHFLLKDHAKAFEWYTKAAAKEHAFAIHMVGYSYLNGLGVSKDPVKAVEYYERAAAKEEHNSLYQLGWMYKNGFGVPVNYNNALHWFQRAADKGNQHAKAELADMYENGIGVKEDKKKAQELRDKQSGK